MKRIPDSGARPKICFVVSAPSTARSFLNGHIDHLSAHFDVTVVCKFDGSETLISKNARLKNLPIVRRISPIHDALAIIALFHFLKNERFDIVHSVTPKAGLVTAIASWSSRTPIRIHWFTGQVWVLLKGLRRSSLIALDHLVSHLSTHLLVDSKSQREFLIQHGVMNVSKSQVLGSGSIAGVDIVKFKPVPTLRSIVREELGIFPESSKIILFVGRLHPDKGIDKLLEVFLSETLIGDPYLLLVGPDEGNYLQQISQMLSTNLDRFRYVPTTSEPERYMVAADIFCLPSLREGFGLSIIEASACELPTIASNIYGVIDAVADGETGILIAPNDIGELQQALNKLLSNDYLRTVMGKRARTRSMMFWDSKQLQRDLEAFYRSILADKTQKKFR